MQNREWNADGRGFDPRHLHQTPQKHKGHRKVAFVFLFVIVPSLNTKDLQATKKDQLSQEGQLLDKKSLRAVTGNIIKNYGFWQQAENE